MILKILKIRLIPMMMSVNKSDNKIIVQKDKRELKC
ncbi:hypothetical protein CLORY_37770 [Clostridium oryzae]|uniref:Uncharacterized protein n=1 Tax=Clostridium oryzae TaxID=1450648 RepID=A0A1V4IE04_9CLOT|nr:hypothetical protein CLORY_37770 [Clostridium oryzae]